MVKGVFSLIVVLLASALSGACTMQPTSIESSPVANSAVTVTVTRDFGRDLILEKDIEITPGTSALEALQSIAYVVTNYGGGFVSAINGVGLDSASGSKQNWFFYINGVAAKVGAGDYTLQPGDREQWDFRDWSYQQFVPAIVGAFPQPFPGGYGGRTAPTAVVYEEPFGKDAEALGKTLRGAGVAQVDIVGGDSLSDEIKQHSNLIIIAGPENGLVAEMNQIHKKLGFYAYLESKKITVLDAAGAPSGDYGPGAGLVQATQNPWNPRGIGAAENVAWMITGPDADGVRNAVAALVNNTDGLRHAYAVVVSEGKIIKIP